jgi:hypothetical protein
MSMQLVAAFVITTLSGVVMFWQGLAANLLERRPSRCRSCGGFPGRTCSCDRED